MAVGDVDGDVLGHEVFSGQLVHGGAVGGFDTQRDGGIHAFAMHVAHELDVVQIKAVHHVKVVVLRQPKADAFVYHRLHVGRHHRQAEGTAA